MEIYYSCEMAICEAHAKLTVLVKFKNAFLRGLGITVHFERLHCLHGNFMPLGYSALTSSFVEFRYEKHELLVSSCGC